MRVTLSFVLAAIPLALSGRPALAQKYPIVKVSGPAPADWHLQLETTIKGPDGVGFSQIGVLLLDPRGGILIYDRKDNTLYRFDAAGKPLGTLGRVGSGPMEFRNVNSLAWLGADLLVYDPGNGRTLRWSRDGKFIAQYPILGTRVSGNIPTIPGPNGTAWLMQYGLGPTKQSGRNYIHFPPTGQGDTLWLTPKPPAKLLEKGDASPDGVITCYFGPQGGSLTDFTSPYRSGVDQTIPAWDGQLIGISGFDYRLARTSGATGDTIGVVERVAPRIPISDAEWKKVTDEVAEFKQTHSDASCRGSLDRTRTKPAVRDLRADDAGRVWVETYTQNGFRWDVWQGEKLVGSLVTPERTEYSPMTISSDRFVLTKESPEGGTNVLVYRIVK